MPTPISVTEAAAELGVSRSRVLALIRADRLPALKVGQQFIIKPADLERVRVRPVGRPPTSSKKGKR